MTEETQETEPTAVERSSMRAYMNVCLEVLGHIFILNKENEGKLMLSMYAHLDVQAISVIGNFKDPPRDLAFTLEAQSLAQGLPLESFRAAVEGLKFVDQHAELRKLIDENDGIVTAAIVGEVEEKGTAH